VSTPVPQARTAHPPAPRRRGQMSAADRDAVLRDALTEIGLALDDARIALLLEYIGLLDKWNGVYNLTAVRDPDQMLLQHVVDSLAVIPALVARQPLDGARIADVGSGAGLPGIPLAIVYPGATVQLIDPVGKKSAFQRQCQAELGLRNLIVTNARAESVTQTQDLVICRAFASLADFVASARGMTGPQTLLAAMKGQSPDDEIAALPPGLSVETVPIAVPRLGAARHLVLIAQHSHAE
jgi:16S rRNA (guanine527-N7)-methyltransferase